MVAKPPSGRDIVMRKICRRWPAAARRNAQLAIMFDSQHNCT